MNEKELKKLLDFEPGLSSDNIHNREAAEVRRWRYDSARQMYVDEDGCLMADRFGQSLG